MLRHSRATQLASIMSDAQLKNYLGWTQSSKMAGIYVHMSGKDADDAILRANNIQIEHVKKDPALKPLKCMKCKMVNPATNRFCNSCGFVLDSSTADSLLKDESQEERAADLLNKLLQDKDVTALLQKKMMEMQHAKWSRNI